MAPLLHRAAIIILKSLSNGKRAATKSGFIFGRPFVKRFALCYQAVVCFSLMSVCLSCPVLSVTLVYCGQTAGWIKMKIGVQVGLGPGHILLDVDPASLLQRGTAPNFLPLSVVAK